MTKTVRHTVTTALLGAAELLRQQHWGIGEQIRCNEQGELVMCSTGAIIKYISSIQDLDVVQQDNLIADAVDQLHSEIWKSHPAKPHVTAWNDRICKSKEDVLAMFDRAAAVSES